MKVRILYLLALCFCYTISFAQGVETLSDVLTQCSVEKEGKEVLVNLNFDLAKIKVKSNRSVVYTPVLSAANGLTKKELPAVVLSGRSRYIIQQRQGVASILPVQETEPYVVLKQNKKQKSLAYTFTIPYEKWMRNGNLNIDIKEIGCANCGKGEGFLTVLRGVMPTTALNFVASTIQPKAEIQKIRSEKFTASFNYKVNRTELLRNYKDNARKLSEVDSIVKAIKAKENVEVSYVDIAGYASPEGSLLGNFELSKGRALVFKNYLKATHGLDEKQMRVSWYGSDWDGLITALTQRNVLSAEENKAVLQILKTTASNDERKAKLMAYRGGVVYKKLLNEVYPSLRRNDYTVSYTVGNYSLEQAKRLIKTDPKLLSLNEMYAVAQSYPFNSADYVYAIETAYKCFPAALEAKVNKSALLIVQGKNEEAVALLEDVDNQGEACNNLAVAYANLKQLDKAKEYFEKGVSLGSLNAQNNLTQLLNDE